MMFWMDAWKLGASAWQNGLALHETAVATQGVIGHRSRTIGEAMRNPLEADIPELNRMVSEKVTAFGQSGASLMTDWSAIQTEMLAHGRDLAAIAMTGQPPTNAALQRIGRRASRIMVRMGTSGGRALAPVHATATANYRRLDKRKPPLGQ